MNKINVLQLAKNAGVNQSNETNVDPVDAQDPVLPIWMVQNCLGAFSSLTVGNEHVKFLES